MIEHRTLERLMVTELVRLRKEAAVIHVRHYSGICLEALRNTTKTFSHMAGVLAEIQTGHFWNASQRYYCNGQSDRRVGPV
jgi:hypothetical protein